MDCTNLEYCDKVQTTVDCTHYICRVKAICYISYLKNTHVKEIEAKKPQLTPIPKYSKRPTLSDPQVHRNLQGEKGCVFCGATHRITIDHIKPKSKGGTNRRENLQILCVECNTLKADRYPFTKEDYIEYLRIGYLKS